MNFAIELFFDKETEDAGLRLASLVADAGISKRFFEWKTRPHVTLAIFKDVDEAECIKRLGAFASSHAPLPACLGSLGAFPDTKTVFASPVMTERTYSFQRELHGAMSGFDTTGGEWYLPDRWVPHCALALTGDDAPDAFYRAADLLLRNFSKMSGAFSEIGLVKITFPVEEIYTAKLSGN